MNEGNTGGHQPILSQPTVPAAAVAPIVESITDKYVILKKTVHDYLVSLPPGDPAWNSTYLPELAKLVGIAEP